MSAPDVIDDFAGVSPGSAIDLIRNNRAEARENAEKSYRVLFEPDDESHVTRAERLAVAVFVVELHAVQQVSGHYLDLLRKAEGGSGWSSILHDEARSARTQGPYGRYPAGPLSAEDRDGPDWRTSDAARARLGVKLGAALDHAHLLVLHPRDASREALQKLLAAGWSTTGIVTLSQIVAFLAFQIRVAAGLRALNNVIDARLRAAAE